MKEISSIGWSAIVLAAGKGTRMRSPLPKVLHKVAGRTMLERVVDAVLATGIDRQILVLGGDLPAFDDILARYPGMNVCLQDERKGTADAVAAAGFGLQGVTLPNYAAGRLVRGESQNPEYLLICLGDTPCLRGETLKSFLTSGIASQCRLGVLGMVHPQPTGYGRLIQDARGHLLEIVEEKDASEKQREVTLCNSGIIYGEKTLIFELLAQVKNSNRSREYYLTDCFAVAAAASEKIFVYESQDYREFDGVNTPEQLSRIATWFEGGGRV